MVLNREMPRVVVSLVSIGVCQGAVVVLHGPVVGFLGAGVRQRAAATAGATRPVTRK